MERVEAKYFEWKKKNYSADQSEINKIYWFIIGIFSFVHNFNELIEMHIVLMFHFLLKIFPNPNSKHRFCLRAITTFFSPSLLCRHVSIEKNLIHSNQFGLILRFNVGIERNIKKEEKIGCCALSTASKIIETIFHHLNFMTQYI